MQITPDSSYSELTENGSISWRIEDDRLGQQIDEVDTLKQSIECRLKTIKEGHLIYSDDYGSEIGEMIGQDVDEVAIENVIRTSLLKDDRIEAVRDFEITKNDEVVNVRFTVVSEFGDVEMEVEV